MKTPEGEVVGEHYGLMYYTLGQRQGLGIGGRPDATDEPWYVAAKNIGENTLINTGAIKGMKITVPTATSGTRAPAKLMSPRAFGTISGKNGAHGARL